MSSQVDTINRRHLRLVGKRFIALSMVVIAVGALVSVWVWQYTTPAPFFLRITTRPAVPQGMGANVLSIAGQKCVFLVEVVDEEGWRQGRVGVGEAVDITTIESSGQADVTVHPQRITAGQVAEVTVVPSVACVNETFPVIIRGEREAVTQTQTVTIEMLSGEDGLHQYAAEMLGLFIPWLGEHRPELGITLETEWIGTIVNPRVLVVMHYIFYSEDWEMYVTWHVTIPPHDWTRVYLRHRFSEVAPSYAFEISSVTSHADPHEIGVPDWV